MASQHYISGCVFTTRHPELSKLIQNYVNSYGHIKVARCCVPNYRVKDFSEQMQADYRSSWDALPESADFAAGDIVWSICHNCAAILQETRPDVTVKSIWELILADENFNYPDYSGLKAFIQDCWRSRENAKEQEAVRAILQKMNIVAKELPQNHGNTEFCGNSLYRPSPKRNLEMAPRRFVKNAGGKFAPHSKEEQQKIMQDYCAKLGDSKIISYCHYCLEGLELGGSDAIHLAKLLFEPDAWKE